MTVSESDTLLAALDRRLQVDRILALDPVAPLSAASGPARAASATPTAGAGPASPPATLQPGRIVQASVVDVPETGHVRVEIGNLQLTLAWPNAQTPGVGSQIALRVLAQTPMLLFEQVVAEEAERAATDVPTHLSAAARALQSGRTSSGDRTQRFTAPILRLEVDGQETPLPVDEPARPANIPLDQVLVARGPVTERAIDPATVMPLVLHGPAWPGQNVELVVRRDREDDAFDNAALDQWCGELVIDLPMLGRVSGHLSWSMKGLRVRLEGADATSVALMSTTAPEFARALADVGLPVLALSVGQPIADNGTGHP